MKFIDRNARFNCAVLLVLATAIGSTHARADEPPKILAVEDLDNLENPAPDVRIPYGEDPLQFGDLRLPPGPGPHPVAIFIHGGCWLSAYDISHSGKLTDALARNGIASWSLEYRRVGDEGGGWPGTFLDIGAGADHLRGIATEYELDLNQVITMGHSAGGHLAIWAASRSQIPVEEPIGSKDPLPVRGALALTPAPDLENLHEQQVCGHVIDGLMGGSPLEYPGRYRWGSPMQNAPAGVPQTVIVGKYDADWGPSGHRYYETANTRGDDIRLIEAPESGHFDIIDSDSTTWALVLRSARDMLGIH